MREKISWNHHRIFAQLAEESANLGDYLIDSN
jgi:hypothetical protein